MPDPRNKITDYLERTLIGPKKVDEVVQGREPLLNYVSGKLFARDTAAEDVRIEDYEELEGESSDDTSVDSPPTHGLAFLTGGGQESFDIHCNTLANCPESISWAWLSASLERIPFEDQ